MQRFQIFLIISTIALIISCSKDKLDPNADNCPDVITYEADIKPIVDRTCSYSGCHDGANAPGNYNSFAGLSPFLNDSKFKARVIDRQDMPPNYSDGPTSLTQEELILIRCWMNGGYKEN